MKKILFLLILSIIFFIIAYTQILQANNDIIDHDDISIMFNYSTDFINTYFIHAYHGRFITNTIATFIGVILPLNLDIHPNEWMHGFGTIIKSIWIFIICYLLSSTLFLFIKKKNILYDLCTCLFILIFYFLYQNTFNNTFEAVLYMSFYGFTFPFIIYFIFWKNFIKHFCNKDSESNISKKKIIYLSILSFLVGYSSEFFSFSTFATLTFLIFYLLIKKNYALKNCLFLYLFNIIGVSLYVLLPGFLEQIYNSNNKLMLFSSFYKDSLTGLMKLLML